MTSSKNLIQAAAGVGGGDFYPYTVDNSARFNQADDPYLYRTLSTTYSTYTFSAWVKLTALFVDYAYLFSSCAGSTQKGGVALNPSGNFYMFKYSGSTSTSIESAIRRDPSAWYHVVMKVSSGTASLHINGVQVLSGFSANSLQTGTNQTIVGAFNDGSLAYHWDGYMSEVALITGTAYDPTDFAEDKNGVWVPKDISGLTFGTDGFYLDFSNSAALGTDVSGNGNNLTSSGLTSSDQMIDTPTSNHATWNPLKFRSTSLKAVLAEGNLKATFDDTGSIEYAYGTMAVTSGKWYWEHTCNAVGGEQYIGVVGANVGEGNPSDSRHYRNNGNKYLDGGSATAYGATWTTGDIMGCELDMDNGTIEFFKNGSSQGVAYTDLLTAMPDGGWAIMAGGYNNSACTIHTSSDKWTYTPSTNFVAMSTANLPEPTIGPNSAATSDENFNTVLYTGNGTSQNVTGFGFDPDMVWHKGRSVAYSHSIVDVIRGDSNVIFTNTTDAEQNPGAQLDLIADGATVTYRSANLSNNQSGSTYVIWGWKANGSGVSNTDGTTTSTVSANTDAGFSIGTYTAPISSAFTVGHGLTATPDMVIIKAYSDAYIWSVMHIGAGNLTSRLQLSTTAAAQTGIFTAPTSSVINLPASYGDGADYLFYAFHSVEGFSKFGSYTGNGSTDGPFIFTGMRPAWLITKRIDSTSSWYVWDAVRDAYNPIGTYLVANVAQTEQSLSTGYFDFLSNGFKLRDTSTEINASGGTYIYIAFAENPFKYSNAR